MVKHATLVTLLAFTSVVNAAQWYVTDQGTGTKVGSVGNTWSIAGLNAWTNITAGDTIHLQGTITNAITCGGSGDTGNPVTILFDSGAVLEAPYWGNGAIIIGNNTNIVIDGGVNGLIQATANGSGLAYTNGSIGVYIGAPSGANDPGYITVQNLTISNMYKRIAGIAEVSVPHDTISIKIYGHHITVKDNHLVGAENGITLKSWQQGKTNSDITIFNNDIFENCISLSMGADPATNTVLYNLNIVSNRFDHWSTWSATSPGSGSLHMDGIYMFMNPGSVPVKDYIDVYMPDTAQYPLTKNYVIVTNGVTFQMTNAVGRYWTNGVWANNWTNGVYTITNSGLYYTLKTNGADVLCSYISDFNQYAFYLGAMTEPNVWGSSDATKTTYPYTNGFPVMLWHKYDMVPLCSISNVVISHNYFGPDVFVSGADGGASVTTAAIFATWYSLTESVEIAKDFKIFNNVCVWTNTSITQLAWANGFIRCNGWGNSIVANNTIVSVLAEWVPGTSWGSGTAYIGLDTTAKFYNNFNQNLSIQYTYDNNSGKTQFNAGMEMDYNCWANLQSSLVGPANNDFFSPPATPRAGFVGQPWSAWTNAATFPGFRFDMYSTTNTPSINADFTPATGDTVLIGKGTNLTSWGITDDFNGNPRPATGPWTIGAFETASTNVTASFTGTPVEGLAPLTVTFADASSNPETWAWTFGDTGTSTSQHPSHTYTSAGTYTVALTITGSGHTDAQTRTGYIHATNAPAPVTPPAIPLATSSRPLYLH
jgi:hypothetical protein